MATPYKLLEDYLDLKKDDAVVEFLGNNYGCKRDDEEMLGVECMAVTRMDGGPFRIVPVMLLEEQKDYSAFNAVDKDELAAYKPHTLQ